MIPVSWWKWIGLGALVIVLIGFGWYIKGTIEENKRLKAAQEQIIKRLAKEEQKNARQDELFAERDEKQNAVRAGVADVTVRIKQEESRDPPTASFNDTVLPAGLRRAVLEAAARRTSAKREGVDSGDKDRRKVSGQHGTDAGPDE
jgi:hypothetical protein